MPFTYTATVLTETYSYTGTSTVTNIASIDMTMVTFNGNTFTTNAATGGSGITDILGVPRIYFIGETYTTNGDSATNVITALGGSWISSSSRWYDY